MNDFDDQIKAIATVRDVCRMVGLSPARFYQLVHQGIFPMPVYDIVSRRPHFTQDQQRQCLDIRRRNCGANNKPICFYARRLDAAPPVPRRRAGRQPSTPRAKAEHAGLVEALRGLGLASVTAPMVAAAVKQVFPRGTSGLAEAEVIKAVFLHLRRQDRGDSAGR